MGSTSSMSRESKKRQLRRQVVPTGYRPNEEESREAIEKAHRRVVRRRLIIFLVIAGIAVVTILGFWYYDRHHEFTDYQPIWEQDLAGEAQDAAKSGEGSFCAYVDFAEGVLKYTNDGASYIDAKGKTVWVQSYEMRAPIVAVNGEYAAIADRQGNSIYICNTAGCQGQATTLLPILQVSVSAKGVAAAIEEDAKASYIYLYRKDGKPLDIYVKSLLSGDGYPIDVSLSPGGTQWITSFMYLEQGMIKNKVVFYNFGLGKDDPRRVVGVFLPKDLGDAMAGRVHFLDESHAVSFSDKGLQFFSTRVETSPESIKQVMLEENIRSICYDETKVGVITDNTEGSEPYCLRIYDAEGAELLKVPFNYQYTGFDIDGDLILLYNDSSCQVYNMAGTKKFNGAFDFTVSKVSAGRFPETLLVMGPQKMMELKMQ